MEDIRHVFLQIRIWPRRRSALRNRVNRIRHAAEQGAPAVEAYPRAGDKRTGDDSAHFGTEPLFRQAGFRVVRGPLENRPRNWIARVTMRVSGPYSAGWGAARKDRGERHNGGQ